MMGFFVWRFCFGLLAVAMLFGFYGLARRQSVLIEVGYFLMALCAGVAVSAFLRLTGAITLQDPDAVDFIYCSYVSSLATLVAGVPRIVYRTLVLEQLNMAFLFRLSAYFAVVAMLGSSGQVRDVALNLAWVVVAVGGLFFAIQGLVQRFQSNWPIAVLVLPVGYFAAQICVVAYRFKVDLGSLFQPMSDGFFISTWLGSNVFFMICWFFVRSLQTRTRAEERSRAKLAEELEKAKASS